MWDLKKYETNTALIEDSGRMVTYRELQEIVREIGRIVPERSLVFQLCENTIDSVAGYVAFLENRIVPALVKCDLEEELLDDLLAVYRPNYIYLPKKLAERFNDMQVVCTHTDYVLLFTGNDVLAELYPQLALLLSTSGSTGSPKLVRQSYRNLESNTGSIVEYLKLTETERAITTLPMNYTYGLSIINTHLAVGAAVCMTEYSMLRGEFWDFFETCGATSFGGVPYTYEILYKMQFTKRNLPSLRYMTQAGGKLSPELHKVFAQYAQDTGKQFIVMYGQTEATARMAYLPGEKALEKYGSTGIAIPGGYLWLRDVDGNKIEKSGVVGELVYEGDNVTLGYAQTLEELALGDERHGILETGDMAYYDEEGYFFIVGRLKRFLKLFGNRVNLDETERMLRASWPEYDLACGGHDDLLKVYIVSEDADLKKEIRAFLSEKMSLSPMGFKVVSAVEIPRSEAGKIQYKLLEEYVK